jgi:nitroreductase/NAD-dependent dihydropyrimidine dehydrogenase PreA subunit
MVIVDAAQCSACGTCVEICHEHCMALAGGDLHIDHDVCSTCTQCVAICPRQALSWDGVPPLPFDAAQLPTAPQLGEVFKQRRSIRFFKPQKIERELVEEITNQGAYAPSHSHELRAILVDDDEIIELLDAVLLRYIRHIYNAFFRWRIMALLARLIGFSREHALAKPKLEAALERNQAFHHPPAIVFIVGEKRFALQEASAYCMLANATYYAQALGVGTCLWANGPMVIDKSRRARRRLGIQSGERIYAAGLLGYPAVRFRNKVEGRRIALNWNGVLSPAESQEASPAPTLVGGAR